MKILTDKIELLIDELRENRDTIEREYNSVLDDFGFHDNWQDDIIDSYEERIEALEYTIDKLQDIVKGLKYK